MGEGELGRTTVTDLHHERLVAHCSPSFTDERGDITNILDGVEIRHIAIITSVAGSHRGSHYHPSQDQYIYVVSGELLSYSMPVIGDARHCHLVIARAGDLLHCPPMVAHVYRFPVDTVFLNIDSGIRNPSTYPEDTIPFTLPLIKEM